MDEERYWRWQTKRATVVTLFVAATVIFCAPLSAAALDAAAGTYAGPGFLTTVEGGLALLVVVVFWYCAKQNRAEEELDRLKGD